MIEIPGAVRAYLEDNVLNTTVDALAVRKPTLPADLTWDDLDNCYQAVGAAHAVKVEHARFLHELWDEIWGESVRSLALPRPADVRANSNFTVEDCWENRSYDRIVERPQDGGWVWLSVDLERKALGVSVAVDEVASKQLKKLLPGDVNWKTGDDGWVNFDGGDPLDLSATLRKLKDAAAAAWVAVAAS